MATEEQVLDALQRLERLDGDGGRVGKLEQVVQQVKDMVTQVQAEVGELTGSFGNNRGKYNVVERKGCLDIPQWNGGKNGVLYMTWRYELGVFLDEVDTNFTDLLKWLESREHLVTDEAWKEYETEHHLPEACSLA